jgi:thiamine-phosphate pyrophosphorylase
VNADGLHLGQDDLTVQDARRVVGEMQVGISTHDPEQAAQGEREGADLVAFGPVFKTGTKASPDPVVGLQRLADVCRSVSRPIVAIGGITPENAGEAFLAGARYVAVISALPSFLRDP